MPKKEEIKKEAVKKSEKKEPVKKIVKVKEEKENEMKEKESNKREIGEVETKFKAWIQLHYPLLVNNIPPPLKLVLEDIKSLEGLFAENFTCLSTWFDFPPKWGRLFRQFADDQWKLADTQLNYKAIGKGCLWNSPSHDWQPFPVWWKKQSDKEEKKEESFLVQYCHAQLAMAKTLQVLSKH